MVQGLVPSLLGGEPWVAISPLSVHDCDQGVGNYAAVGLDMQPNSGRSLEDEIKSRSIYDRKKTTVASRQRQTNGVGQATTACITTTATTARGDYNHDVISEMIEELMEERGGPEVRLKEVRQGLPFKPSIVTVERAAAAKIYLETYFHNLLSKPDARASRLQSLDTSLFYSPHLTADQASLIRQTFLNQERAHSRESRVLKARSSRAARGLIAGAYTQGFEQVGILGKGSFGVVRLVRETTIGEAAIPGQVYAMKVIRKAEMLRSSQEGHLRAERDFLVASNGSEWIVPLVASFQDSRHLYLVMEYMSGGDFLGLLIRENILHEAVARFYTAEMILCVEEAHRLRVIHRDIKPDNFLISASGHLKISDFGLAFDGHWSHDASYYNYHRYSLLSKHGIEVEGDEQDRKNGESLQKQVQWPQMVAGKKMDRHQWHSDQEWYGSGTEGVVPGDLASVIAWRNRCGIRTSANSCVGTSQYMAPEVVQGVNYDGRCDWWSVGIILFECLYGHTPFLSDEGRAQTKRNILEHKARFYFPERPVISDKCKDLISRLIEEKEYRLSCHLYYQKDRAAAMAVSGMAPTPPSSTTTFGIRDVDTSGNSGNSSSMYSGHYVFPNDGEDIKAHRWFRNMPWDRLHLLSPPFVPHLNSPADTHYFDDEDPVSDVSESVAVEAAAAGVASGRHYDGEAKAIRAIRPADIRKEIPWARSTVVALTVGLMGMLAADPTKLHRVHGQVDADPRMGPDEKRMVKEYLRLHGPREHKRARDKLLRDSRTRAVVMDVRMKTAFLGYTWRRMRRSPLLAF